MLWRIIVISCAFLQQVKAEYNNMTQTAIWRSFEWKMTVLRGRQDEIAITGVLDEVVAQNKVKIPGANCSDAKKWTAETKENDIPTFVMICKCNLKSSTFVPNLKICVANNEVKNGCQFTTGSWQWNIGWRWDTKDDSLIVLDNDRDYGIATGFNVTTTEYHSCSMVSVSYWVEKINWIEAPGYILNDSKPVMFRLLNMWHFSWNVEDMNAKVKGNLRGTILKFLIECEKPGPPKDEDEELEITSCFMVKVAGELNFTSKDWELFQNATVNTEAMTTSSYNQEKLLISILVPQGLLLVVVGVVVAVCYTRRTACFAEREDVRHVTVLDDDVVQTKLISNPTEKSIV